MRRLPAAAGLASLSDALIAPLIEEEGRGEEGETTWPLDRSRGREPDTVWPVPFFDLETRGHARELLVSHY